MSTAGTSTTATHAGRPSLQLFPPPTRARSPTEKSPVELAKEHNWPQRTASRRTPAKVTVSIPEPVVERKANGKSPVDFHEFVIRVDSPIKSPGFTTQISSIEAPKRAHIPGPRTPPTDAASSPPNLPPRARSVSPVIAAQPFRGTSPTPSDVRPGTAISTDAKVTTTPELQSIASPTSAARSPSPTTHLPSPPQQRVASPIASGAGSPRSGSPALVRSNSCAKQRTISPEPVMRSMFPQYNPNLSLNQQTYLPTQASPTHIPQHLISRPLYSPTHYTPYSNLENNRSEGAATAKPTPYFTPSTALDSLWNAANGQEIPMIQRFTLQMHRHAAAQGQSNQPQISFGPTQSLPFYSLCHTDLPNPDGRYDDDDEVEHELLIRRHHPTKPTNVPVSHLTLNAAPASSPTNPTESQNVITTVYPKLAAMAALDIAAQSPAASHIAAFDPDASSPAAQRLAEDVLRGTAERECCALIWTKSASHLPTSYTPSCPGTYALHHPTLGIFPITHEGDTSPGLTPVLGTLPFSPNAAPPARRGNNKPTVITLLNPFAPSPSSGSSSAVDDTILARLDFSADSLVLNIHALLSLKNTYFIDVVVSTLLAVALAEERRLRRAMAFDAPPQYPYPPPPRTPRPGSAAPSIRSSPRQGVREVAEGKDKRKKLFGFMRSGSSKSPSTTLDKDIELAPWGEFEPDSARVKPLKQRKRKSKKEVDEHELPGLARGILKILEVVVKTVIWVLGVAFKIVASTVVRVSKTL